MTSKQSGQLRRYRFQKLLQTDKAAMVIIRFSDDDHWQSDDSVFAESGSEGIMRYAKWFVYMGESF